MTARILTVCTANMVRSPLAELYLRAQLGGLPVLVQSAGTIPGPRDHMADRAKKVALELGLPASEIEAHRPRRLTRDAVEGADLILGMSREHRSAAVQLDLGSLRYSFTAREFARMSREVPDERFAEALASVAADPRERVRAVASVVVDMRGLVEPPGKGECDDIVDPGLRGRRPVYAQALEEMLPALDEVARVMRFALAA